MTNKIDAAMGFLRDALASGPQPCAAVMEAAARARISPATLRRARIVLGVAVERQGFAGNGMWVWRLPQQGEPHRGSKMDLDDIDIELDDGELDELQSSLSEEGQAALEAALSSLFPPTPKKRRT